MNFDTDRAHGRRASSASTGVAPNSLDAVSNRDFVLDYLGAAATCATHLSRLGAELVLWSSEEFGFVRALGRVGAAAARSCRRRRTPTPPSCCARRRRASSATSSALYGVLHALPLTYNKDLQEDKEHLFDAVDTLRAVPGGVAGHARGATFDRERMADAASDELIAATDVADLLVRRGVPFRESHGIVAGLVRDGRRRAAARCRSFAPEELARTPTHLDDGVAEVLAQLAPGSSRRSARAAPRSARVREQLELARGAARRLMAAALPADFYARPVARGRARPRRLRRAPRRHGGRDRRDRGLPRQRAGLPRLRRADAAHADAVRAARDGLRLPLLRHPRAAQRGLRGRGHRAPRC